MATKLTLQLRNRSKTQVIKRLPSSIELPAEATVEDAKILIAKQAGVSDFNRIGLFDPSTNKTLKDRKALVKDQKSVVAAGEVLVKDLGPQMGWRTVYIIEYIGPILFHSLIPALRPYIYSGAESHPLTQVQWLCLALFQVHFWKRELETVFVHRFAANTMPAAYVFRNSGFYWLVAGLLCALVIYAPPSYAALGGLLPLYSPVRDELTPLDYAGLVVFVVSEACNAIVHLHLASLRAPGTTGKGIPNCIGSSLVTSPNYMFEVFAWVGVILVSRSWAVVLFIGLGIIPMAKWARGKEKALREIFGDKYKRKRYGVLPGLI